MSESGLSIGYDDIQQTVRDFLGDETQDVGRFIQAGYRLALAPPPLGPNQKPHKWSFLTPEATLYLWPETTTGAGTVGGEGNITLTVDDATFYPSMVNATITADTSGTEYIIAGYTSSTVVTLSADASADNGDTFTITPGLYALPDDFGSIKTDLWYAQGLGLPRVRLVDEPTVRDHLATISSTGDPTIFAVVPRRATDAYNPMAGTSGNQTRWDAMVWPTPSAVRAVTYTYGRLVPDELDSETHKYPIGGMEFGLLVEQAAVAMAEIRQRGGAGEQYKAFMVMLSARVLADTGGNLAVNLGYNGDHSDGRSAWPHPNVSYPVTHCAND